MRHNHNVEQNTGNRKRLASVGKGEHSYPTRKYSRTDQQATGFTTDIKFYNKAGIFLEQNARHPPCYTRITLNGSICDQHNVLTQCTSTDYGSPLLVCY